MTRAARTGDMPAGAMGQLPGGIPHFGFFGGALQAE
jgi:hypothetical protein